MKISFYKGCFSRTVNIKSDDLDIFLLDGWDSNKQDWDDNLSFLKQILIKMSEKISEKGQDRLKTIYRYFVESSFKEIDYKEPVQETDAEVLKRVVDYVNSYDLNKESGSLHEFVCIIEEFLSVLSVGQDPETEYRCEQCGDHNYSYDVNFDF
jgi:hypothetical protein